MSIALIIVDVQHDFTVGSLAVPDAEAIIEPIADLSEAYEYVVASQDYHPPNHMSFAANGGPWPTHCVQGEPGQMLDIRIRELDATNVYKGHVPEYEAYSAFDGHVFGGTSLAGWLHDRDVRRVDICGLALDYCVRATALDAAGQGFEANVLLDLTRPVTWVTGARTIIDLRHDDVRVSVT